MVVELTTLGSALKYVNTWPRQGDSFVYQGEDWAENWGFEGYILDGWPSMSNGLQALKWLINHYISV